MAPDLNRRRLLICGAVGAALGTGGNAQAADRSSLLADYRVTRGFQDRAAFWITRGTKYALVGTRFIPFQRSAVVEAVRFADDGGALKASILEGAFSLNLDGQVSHMIENPLTHTQVTIPPGAQVRVAYRYGGDGSMETVPSPQIHGVVRGGIAIEPANGGAPAIREAFEGFFTLPATGEPALSEISIFKADQGSSSPNGFLRATKTVMVARRWTYALPAGVSASLLGLYEGEKFHNADALVAAFGAAAITAAYPDLIEQFRAF
jgi:hypothetical protein